MKAHVKKPAENDDHSQTMKHSHRKENEFGLIRHRMWFTSNGKVLHDAVLLQYCINKVICGDVDEVIFTVQKHGNCKGDGRFYSTKKSTILDLKTKLLGLGKRKASQLYNDVSNDEMCTDFGDQPWNKKQCENIASHFSSGIDEVETILGFNEEMSPDNMIWYHGDIPSGLWVMGDKLMKVGLPNAAKSQPVSVDPTFNFGDYEVTPFTYRHPPPSPPAP